MIEEYVNVRGVPLRLVDTAGIRETEDIVERIGVERSRQVLKEADLILLVLNHSEELSEEDVKLFEAVEGMDVIVIMNKTDLEAKIDAERVKELAKVCRHDLIAERRRHSRFRGSDSVAILYRSDRKRRSHLCQQHPSYLDTASGKASD